MAGLANVHQRTDKQCVGVTCHTVGDARMTHLREVSLFHHPRSKVPTPGNDDQQLLRGRRRSFQPGLLQFRDHFFGWRYAFLEAYLQHARACAFKQSTGALIRSYWIMWHPLWLACPPLGHFLPTECPGTS